eukprot:scaffold136952_cov142-Phaeocystis_antarctica.AAC.1
MHYPCANTCARMRSNLQLRAFARSRSVLGNFVRSQAGYRYFGASKVGFTSIRPGLAEPVAGSERRRSPQDSRVGRKADWTRQPRPST